MAMNRYLRAVLGAFAGLLSSFVLVAALGNGWLGVLVGTAVGLGYGLAMGPRQPGT